MSWSAGDRLFHSPRAGISMKVKIHANKNFSNMASDWLAANKKPGLKILVNQHGYIMEIL